jgi:hypothetical protein
VDILGWCSRFLPLLLVGITLFEVNFMCLYTHFFGTVPLRHAFFLLRMAFKAQAFWSTSILFASDLFCRVARCRSRVLEFHLESVHHQE